MDTAAIRHRAQASTPGPWRRHGADVRAEGVEEILFIGRDSSPEVRAQADRDAEFVAHAREDVLRLVDALDAKGNSGTAGNGTGLTGGTGRHRGQG